MSKVTESYTVKIDGLNLDLGRLVATINGGQVDIQLIPPVGPLPELGGPGNYSRPMIAVNYVPKAPIDDLTAPSVSSCNPDAETSTPFTDAIDRAIDRVWELDSSAEGLINAMRAEGLAIVDIKPPMTFTAALAMMKSALKSHPWWRKRCDGTPLDNDIPVIAAEILFKEVYAASRGKAGEV